MASFAADLHWLPLQPDVTAALARLRTSSASIEERMRELAQLIHARLDFVQTNAADRLLQQLVRTSDSVSGPAGLRLAIVATSTFDYLLPAVRIGALRHGVLADCWTAPYGQLEQAVVHPSSALHQFDPDVVLFAIDHRSAVPRLPAHAAARDVGDAMRQRIDELTALWREVRTRTKATVIQQTVIDRSVPLFGGFDFNVPASRARMTAGMNRLLAEAAAAEGVLLLDLSWWAGQVGTRVLADPMLWHHAKQEISPAAAPLYGDLVGRTLAAIRGRSRKCLVLDLDNTLWGGVLGDDGLEGLVLGPGSALGEAFVEFQEYLKQLSERGVLLAISSKNDQSLVLEALARHPEMVLRRGDFVAVEANWNDKPAAVQRIAAALSLGLESLVFFDDNPAERELMRRTLPAVAVPEVPEAVEHYTRCLADAGYFEAASFTADDRQRTGQYAANIERRNLEVRCADIDSFLNELQMEILFAPFDELNRPRIVQLINKTNQFNLTGRPYSDAEVQTLMADPAALTIYMRVKDRFGDNGIVAVVIATCGSFENRPAFVIDAWLMSCRVLGRRLENATLDELRKRAVAHGAEVLVGRYAATGRNGLVRDHYAALGFVRHEAQHDVWVLPVAPQQRVATP